MSLMNPLLIITTLALLLLAAVVLMFADRRWRRQIHTKPLADEEIWARVDKRMAAELQSQEVTELRADRALLQAENQVLRGELERVKKKLGERA